MEQLPRIKARLKSLHELRDLIRALRAMAATHVQEAQAALDGIRRYAEVIEGAIAAGAALLPDGDIRSAMAPGSGKSVLMVVCSEHGFVGGFNDRLIEQAVAQRAKDQSLIVIGARGGAHAAEQAIPVDRTVSMATHVGGVLTVARRAARMVAEAGTADIVFGEYRKGAGFEPILKRLLPLDPALMETERLPEPPLHHLKPALLLERLAHEYLLAEITRGIMESLASENGARLRVMESADRNIGDKLEGLQQQEHQLRQEEITSELIDVVTGSEAILSPDGPSGF